MAALQSAIEAHPDWAGQVRGLMVNQGGAEIGLAGCAAETSLPIVQDDAANSLRTALGGEYNGTLVVDRTGHVAARLPNLSLSTDGLTLVEAVTPLL